MLLDAKARGEDGHSGDPQVPAALPGSALPMVQVRAGLIGAGGGGGAVGAGVGLAVAVGPAVGADVGAGVRRTVGDVSGGGVPTCTCTVPSAWA